MRAAKNEVSNTKCRSIRRGFKQMQSKARMIGLCTVKSVDKMRTNNGNKCEGDWRTMDGVYGAHVGESYDRGFTHAAINQHDKMIKRVHICSLRYNDNFGMISRGLNLPKVS